MKKILIVDDIKAIIEKESSILSRSDFSIFTATTSDDALQVHKNQVMDMIIIDLDMPVMSGDKLCSLLRKDAALKNVSIVMICNNSESDIKRTQVCKANAYVTRPVNPVQFLNTVSRLLDVPERKSYRVLVKLSVKGKAKDESFFCSSRNISSTGILVETDKLLEKGDMISCSFFLPKSGQIAADAEIVRAVTLTARSYQYGLRFTTLNPECKSAINDFVNRTIGKR